MSDGGLARTLDRWEAVIGLEVHTHLRTRSKLFSPAPVRYGDPPNHDVHPIDLGLPGVLPVLNERVVELAIRLGLATNSTVHARSVFARKNYFYPDLPKGYQISQYEDPVVSDGWIEVDVPGEGDAPGYRKRVGITRAHLEEDAGKSVHDDAVAGGDDTQLDYNRAGVPLLEIVSEPDLRTPAEAGAYLRALREILRYLDVSEADMEKGQFRCDANVSIRPRGEAALGTRTELKNLNSFRFVEEAIAAEIERQAEVLEDGGRVVQATMAYDPSTGRTRVLRLKEDANDYRYFPDPDLVALEIDPAHVERVRAALPELPERKRARFEDEHGLSPAEAAQLVASRALAALYDATVAAGASPKAVAGWLLRDLLQVLNDRGREVEDARLAPAALARLVALVESGKLTAKNARQIFPELAFGADPDELVRTRGLEAVSDAGALEGVVDEVIAADPAAAAKVRAGDDKPLNALMGQVMKKTRGKADPAQVRALLAEKLRGS
ncbi:MAG: Asp-tRNA(Asn)/Glu-tRNA(Gln) amidotransferase subunit GatB [Myxococcota bacterium]|nr:Asp-tRNA(Asn)/Glu-tRNA(Gln) amidotransferase subunit GatB [Myxococcales bacterium]